MPLFNRRLRVDAAEFCRHWYEHFVFPSDAEVIRAADALVEQVLDQVILAVQEAGFDPLGLDLDLLTDELLALRLELFGTAYAHRTRDKVLLGLAETTTTKQYLSEKGRSDLWERMAIYNQTIAAGPATRGTKSLIRMIDQMRVGLFKDYIKAGAERECAVRALNRLGTDVDFLKIAPSRLGYVLAGQANLEPGDGVVFVLGATAQGYYNGARESLEEVDLQA